MKSSLLRQGRSQSHGVAELPPWFVAQWAAQPEERLGKCSQNSPQIPSSMVIHPIFGWWMIVKIHEDSEEPWRTTGPEDWSVTIDSIRFHSCYIMLYHAIVDLNGFPCGQMPVRLAQSLIVYLKDLMGPWSRLISVFLKWNEVLDLSETRELSENQMAIWNPKPFEEIWKVSI